MCRSTPNLKFFNTQSFHIFHFPHPMIYHEHFQTTFNSPHDNARIMQNAMLNWRIMRVQHSYVLQIAKVIHSKQFFSHFSSRNCFLASTRYELENLLVFVCRKLFYDKWNFQYITQGNFSLALEFSLLLLDFFCVYASISWQVPASDRVRKKFSFSHFQILIFFTSGNSFFFADIKLNTFAARGANDDFESTRKENFTHSTLLWFSISSTFTFLCVWSG